MKAKKMLAMAKLSILVFAMLQTGCCDLKTACNALAEMHLYRYQTCMVLHQELKTWNDAAASCNDIPPSADSSQGHLLHLVEGRPVADLLADLSVSATMHVGIYNTNSSGANERGWYYMRDGAALAEQLPAFYPWRSGEPNADVGAPRMVQVRIENGALHNRLDAPYTQNYWYICQYSKSGQIKMKRQASKDGYKPRADTGCLLKTETGVPHHLLCIMSCQRQWGASLCRSVAYDSATRTCLHAAAHPTLRAADQWQVDGEGAQWTVWALAE